MPRKRRFTSYNYCGMNLIMSREGMKECPSLSYLVYYFGAMELDPSLFASMPGKHERRQKENNLRWTKIHAFFFDL